MFSRVKIANMMDAGILDPLFVAKHAIHWSATEAAINVLRIDDVLWAKQEAQTPDWQNELTEMKIELITQAYQA